MGRGTLKAAAIQMSSLGDKDANLLKAARLVKEAKTAGARLVLLPEYFNCYDSLEIMSKQAEPIPGRTYQFMADLARRWRLYLCGTILVKVSANKVYNTALLFAPTGDLLGRYRKIHLFNVSLPGLNYQESRYILPGRRLALMDVEGFRTALTICFDLRFPGLFQTLASRGADLFLLPSASTATTSRDHWEPLLKARAIENQCYVVTANQFGRHPNGVTTFGHSLIINPWGQVMSGVLKGEGVAVASMDMRFLREVRKKIPLYGDFALCRGERREAR